MATFLTTRNIESAIENLIKTARFKLLFVTPFIHMHPMLIERLTDAAARGVSIDIVCRQKDLKDAQRQKLMAIDHTTLWFMEHLHAKCYANESELILTSMNLYDASRKNREMGVLFSSTQRAYLDAMEEIASIMRSANRYEHASSSRHPAAAPKARQGQPPQRSAGCCIRCAAEIELNKEKPLCFSCYRAWARFKNEDYQESYCHSCATQEAKAISFSKPECYQCWKSSK